MITPLGAMFHTWWTDDGLRGQREMIQILLHLSDADGIVKIKRERRQRPQQYLTALLGAMDVMYSSVIGILISRGADVNRQPDNLIRYTPLQYAARMESVEVVDLLLQHGADINSPAAPHGGGTALQLAAGSGTARLVTKILEAGARLDLAPARVGGRWALEAAAESGKLANIHILWGAKVARLEHSYIGFEDRQCLRAMSFAQENGHIECRDLISELSGISIDRLETDNYGVPWLAY